MPSENPISSTPHLSPRERGRGVITEGEGGNLLTESPCVGICSTTFGDDICYGCQRTYLEVIQWNTLTDEEKNCINRRLLSAIPYKSASE